MLPLSRLKPDDRFDPPPLNGGSTTAATAAGGDELEIDKHMPSPHKQQTASHKPSDPELLKGTVKSEKVAPDGWSSEGSSASSKF